MMDKYDIQDILDAYNNAIEHGNEVRGFLKWSMLAYVQEIPDLMDEVWGERPRGFDKEINQLKKLGREYLSKLGQTAGQMQKLLQDAKAM